MHIPRLLLLLSLVSVFVAPSVAQSASDKKPVPARPQLDGLVAPPEFRANVPTREVDWLELDQRSDLVSKLQTPKLESSPRAYEPEQNDEVCLSMRSYRVKRDDPKSDLTRLAGYSECQPAARFQMKTAVDTREIESR